MTAVPGAFSAATCSISEQRRPSPLDQPEPPQQGARAQQPQHQVVDRRPDEDVEHRHHRHDDDQAARREQARGGLFDDNYYDTGVSTTTSVLWNAPSIGVPGVPAELQLPKGARAVRTVDPKAAQP